MVGPRKHGTVPEVLPGEPAEALTTRGWLCETSVEAPAPAEAAVARGSVPAARIRSYLTSLTRKLFELQLMRGTPPRAIARHCRAVLYDHVPAGIGWRGYAATAGMMPGHDRLERDLVRALRRPRSQLSTALPALRRCPRMLRNKQLAASRAATGHCVMRWRRPRALLNRRDALVPARQGARARAARLSAQSRESALGCSRQRTRGYVGRFRG